MNSPAHNFHALKAEKTPAENLYLPLDQLDASRLAGDLVVYTPTGSEIDELFERTRELMGTAAPLPVIKRIASINP